jgi:hypothetical protein
MSSIYERAAIEQLATIAHKVSCEFTFAGANQKEWIGAAVNAGTIAVATSIAKHPGVIAYLSHASNADSGYKFTTDAGTIVLSGGEPTTAIFKTGATLADITRRIGFHNATGVAAPTDGVYAKIAPGGKIIGNVTVSNVIAATASDYQLLVDTWYRLKIEINAARTITTFTLYADDSDAVLWTDTVTAAIPTMAIRHCDIATLAAPSGATTIGYVDYLDFVPSARRV